MGSKFGGKVCCEDFEPLHVLLRSCASGTGCREWPPGAGTGGHSCNRFYAAAAVTHGSRTTFVQWSCLSRKVLYISGAESIGTRWLITKLGSISPFSIRSSNGFM